MKNDGESIALWLINTTRKVVKITSVNSGIQMLNILYTFVTQANFKFWLKIWFPLRNRHVTTA